MSREKQIIVGVDIRDLQVAKTGQRTVIEELCRQFRTIGDDRFKFVFFDTSIPVYTGKKKSFLLFEHIRYQFWKQMILPVKAWWSNCDILFCGDYFVPYVHLGYKTVEIFYDAFFFEYPTHYNKLWLKIFHHIAIPAARRCSYIMTITEYARKKVHLHTQIPENRLVTIYPGPKSLQAKSSSSTIPVNLKMIEGQKYILHVGVMEKRKNLPALINAFKQLRESGYTELKLVIVGKGNGKTFSDDTEQVKAAIQKNHLENHVILTGYLPDEEVGIIYRHAFMYVFPSINEGFGIPIMEAFKFNLPVLVADNTCLPEVGGDAVITFDPFNEQDIYTKMKQVLDDEQLRMKLIEKGQQRLQQFTWEKAAEKLMVVFKQAYDEQYE